MSLKTILRNFLNHFETLEERRKCPNEDDDLYAIEFQSLKELTESLKRENFYACKHGLKDVNRRKNRYKDILPYDYSRVILSEYPGVPGSDYINANFVRGSTGSACAYVASQGPLPNTVVDFWRMIWECEVRVIVMACNETESGKYKCETYWPAVNDQEQQYGNITAQQIDWRQVCPDFLVRTFRITSDNKERIVCQFHYTTWPDHGVPTTVGPILELVRLMRDVQATEATPILVHCSAGCGRTGTICSIDYVWALLRTGKLKEDFSLYKIIHEMRRQRIAMVQTQEQYILCYRAVAALFEQQLKVIDAHTYENLDEDGEPYHKFAEEANSSSDDEESSPGISEAEIHYRVQRSATFPSKDMKQLVDSWKSKKMTATPSTELPSHPSDSMMFNENQGSHDNKQEKLIGKATVIRRPSIAKFKSMFGSMELAHHQLRSQHSQSHPHHLHNSTHFRPLEPLRLETPSDNGNTNTNNNNNNNVTNNSTNNGNNSNTTTNSYFHGNNFSSRFQDSDCTDSVATSDQEVETDREPSSHYQITANPLCESKKPFSYLAPDQLKAFNNIHHHQPATSSPSPPPPLPPPPPLIGDTTNQDSADDEIDGQPTYESPADILRRQQQHQHHLRQQQQKQQQQQHHTQFRQQLQQQFPSHPMFQRSFDDGMINLMNKHRLTLTKELPPPKPPRTYQYGTKGNTISLMNGRTLLSPMDSNNSGRIIVSVAKRVRPRIHIPNDERPSFPESKSHNDLYSASTYSNLPFSFAQSTPPPPPPPPPPSSSSQPSQATLPSQSNQYYGYVPSSGKHQLDKLSQDANNQPIYEHLKQNDIFSNQINGHDLSGGRSLFRPPIPRISQTNKMINRVTGLPPFISRNQPEPNRFGNLTIRRELTSPPQMLMSHPHPANPMMPPRNHGIFSGLNGHSMIHPIPSRPRPSIQQHPPPPPASDCNDQRSGLSENNFKGRQPLPSQNATNSFNNNQQITRSNSNKLNPSSNSTNGTPRSGIPISATPTPGPPIATKFNNNNMNNITNNNTTNNNINNINNNNNNNNNINDKNPSEGGGGRNEKKKSIKSNSKSNNSKSDSKIGKETNQGNHETKKSSSFSFSGTFFPFRKTAKAKGTTASPNQQSGPQSNPGNNSNIRPPHSHRFSPPTQWTQV